MIDKKELRKIIEDDFQHLRSNGYVDNCCVMALQTDDKDLLKGHCQCGEIKISKLTGQSMIGKFSLDYINNILRIINTMEPESFWIELIKLDNAKEPILRILVKLPESNHKYIFYLAPIEEFKEDLDFRLYVKEDKEGGPECR